MLIEEFSYQYKLKYIINRCGVISGPLQFGKQDQGFISLWIWRHLNNLKLNYEFAIDEDFNEFQYNDINATISINNFVTKFNFIKEI